MSSEQLIQIDSRTELEAIKQRVRGVPVALIGPDSDFLLESRVFCFLGILKVAAELKRNGNHVEVLDLAGYTNYEKVVEKYVRQTNIRTFGITATTPNIPSAVVIRNKIKEVNPNAQVILGGPHATLAYTALLQDQLLDQERRGTHVFRQLEGLFDKLVVGDGEMAVFYAIDPQNTEHIINAGSRQSPLFMQRGTLDNFATPARDLIDLESYKYYIDGFRSTSLISQLGCPFECGFCGGRNTDFLRLARSRSISDGVIREIEEVIQMSADWEEPIRGFMFYDDELNVSTGGLETLCNELINLQKRLEIEMRFRGFIKAELFTPKQAELMAAAGFKIVLSGVESGSDEILTTMRKHTSREINSRCVQIAHNAGLNFKALMSIGHPGETRKTVQESIQWVHGNLKRGDDVDWTIITQYPGTPYFDESFYVPEKDAWLYTESKTGNRLWSRQVDFVRDAEYYKGVPGEYTAYVWTDELSSEELVILRDRAEEITRNVLSLPQISELVAAAKQFEHSMGQGFSPHVLRRSSSTG